MELNSIDKNIKTEVLRRLKNSKQLNASGIIVEVNQRYVTLNGIVPTYRERLMAYKKIKDIDGVFSVRNNLGIAINTDADVPDADKLKQVCELILDWLADCDASKVEVSMTSGIITLKGVVGEYQQKLQIEDIIASLKGVLDIKNELAVVPSELIKDELIAENILSELRSDSLLNAADVDVIVNKGEVTLKGKVPSYKSVTQAYEIAIYSTGVTAVINKLEVGD